MPPGHFPAVDPDNAAVIHIELQLQCWNCIGIRHDKLMTQVHCGIIVSHVGEECLVVVVAVADAGAQVGEEKQRADYRPVLLVLQRVSGVTKIKLKGRLQEIKSGKLKNLIGKNRLIIDGSIFPLEYFLIDIAEYTTAFGVAILDIKAVSYTHLTLPTNREV